MFRKLVLALLLLVCCGCRAWEATAPRVECVVRRVVAGEVVEDTLPGLCASRRAAAPDTIQK